MKWTNLLALPDPRSRTGSKRPSCGNRLGSGTMFLGLFLQSGGRQFKKTQHWVEQGEWGTKCTKQLGQPSKETFLKQQPFVPHNRRRQKQAESSWGNPAICPRHNGRKPGDKCTKDQLGEPLLQRSFPEMKAIWSPERTEDKHLKFVPRPALTMAEDPKAKWGTAVEIFEHLATFFRLEGRSEISWNFSYKSPARLEARCDERFPGVQLWSIVYKTLSVASPLLQNSRGPNGMNTSDSSAHFAECIRISKRTPLEQWQGWFV